MSSDVSYFTQDYWMNSLAIGHPLVYHSQANNENTIGTAPAMDDNYVRFIYISVKHKLIIILGYAVEHYGHGKI
jgi:hypothetical protein